MKLAGVVTAIVACAWPVPAAADEACVAEATELRAHLVTEQRRAFRWNTAWAVAFGAAATTQLVLGLTETKPFGEFDEAYRDTVLVGAAKATLGVGARVLFPLRIDVPAATGDACADRAALRDALAIAAQRERRSFWLTHLGGTALNLAGAALLTYLHSFETGAISFAISYPVGPASAYTQPRRSWKQWRARRASWTVGATTGATSTLWLAGTF